MKQHTRTGRKSVYTLSARSVITLFLLVFTCFFLPSSTLVEAENYVPSTPTGSTIGFVNIEYEYTIVTLNTQSSWMFDWGDGTTTDWLQITGSETSITRSHHWDSVGGYHVRVQFKNEFYQNGVWSNPVTVIISSSIGDNLPDEPLFLLGTIQGFIGEYYVYAASTTDPNDYQVCFRCDWGDENISEWTSLVPSGAHATVTYSWENPGEYSVRIQAKNQYGLESFWSDPVHVTISNTSLGESNTIDLIVLNGISHHIVYTSDQNGIFYNSSSGGSSAIQGIGGGDYLIDDDSDGTWEYVYTPITGSIELYDEPVITQNQVFFLFTGIWPLIFIIVGIVIGITGTVLILIKKGYIYMYEEIVVEK